MATGTGTDAQANPSVFPSTTSRGSTVVVAVIVFSLATGWSGRKKAKEPSSHTQSVSSRKGITI